MEGTVRCSTMYCGDWNVNYDEDGNLIENLLNMCNTCRQSGKCSQGHSIIHSYASW